MKKEVNKNLILDVTIEIPKNSKVKYEYNRATGKIVVDRILFGPSAYPQNYGYLTEALDYDGDELDVIVIADQEFIPGITVPTRIIGAMEMIDGNETDTKLIGVINCDPRYNQYNSIKDLPPHLLLEVKDFFETYKRLQSKSVLIKGFKDVKWAKQEYDICKKLMDEYKNLPKNDFIKLMKVKYPEKYLK